MQPITLTGHQQRMTARQRYPRTMKAAVAVLWLAIVAGGIWGLSSERQRRREPRPQVSDAEREGATAWLAEHPDDPRASAVRARLDGAVAPAPDDPKEAMLKAIVAYALGGLLGFGLLCVAVFCLLYAGGRGWYTGARDAASS